MTPEDIRRIVREGRLAEAAARVRAGTAAPDGAPTGLSSWALVCEEVLDTDFDPGRYDAILIELRRRGFSFETIDRMRAFAWETAGWYNFDYGVWDWVSLDEYDMLRALDLQLAGGLISADEYTRRVGWLDDPTRIA